MSSEPAPEVTPKLVPELAHEAALSVAHEFVPELVHALSVDLAPSPVRGVGREVEKEVGRVSLVLHEVQKVWWVVEVSLWPPDPLESSSLGANSNSIGYSRDRTFANNHHTFSSDSFSPLRRLSGSLGRSFVGPSVPPPLPPSPRRDRSSWCELSLRELLLETRSG